MTIPPAVVRRLAMGLAAAMLIALVARSAARAGEIRVVSSGGFAAAWRELVPQFERQSGDTVITAWGPSMGTTKDAVPMRLARGEPIDVVIMVGAALDELIARGKAVPGSAVALARSNIGAAVKAGAPHPPVATVEELRQTLLAAASIAYSDSASGVYIHNEMFAKLGIADRMAAKARMIPATPVGEIVANGEAEIGFQQISELKPVAGIDLLGPLPAEVQKVTVFSAGVIAGSAQQDAARALIAFLASPAAAGAITRSGMEPAVR